MIEQKIIAILKKSLSIKNDILLEIPDDLSHGDFTTNIAFLIAKNEKKSPMEVAESIINNIDKNELPEVETIQAVKPGYINIFLTKQYLFEQIQLIIKTNAAITPVKHSKFHKKIIIEYSSPNIAKPFAIGHLRSTVIGDALANLLEATGHTVFRDNHVGDWGTQFGKQIYALKTWGDESALEQTADPVKMLVDLYIRFHEEAEKNPELEEKGREWSKKLEDGDLEARRLWGKCIDWSWKEFAKIYQELGTTFTENEGRGYGESFFEDKMGSVIKELEEKELLRESDGAKVIFFPDDKYPPLLIIRKDGASLYATRDLATDKFRLKHYGSDITVINEVGMEQSLYFSQIFAAEEMLGWYKKDQRVHVKHGMYRFKDGKMSTRKGKVIWLKDVLSEAEARAGQLGKDNKLNIDEKVVKMIAIGAIKWNDLKRSSQLDILFDWDDILTMHGNSGPYIQYTYVRSKSILDKIGQTKFESSSGNQVLGGLDKEEVLLLQSLSQFSRLVIASAEQLAPHLLCIYLYQLAKLFNGFYQKTHIMSIKNLEEKQLRISLTEVTTAVLKKGLYLLGIETPEHM